MLCFCNLKIEYTGSKHDKKQQIYWLKKKRKYINMKILYSKTKKQLSTLQLLVWVGSQQYNVE